MNTKVNDDYAYIGCKKENYTSILIGQLIYFLNVKYCVSI